jgi:hypothetical protein
MNPRTIQAADIVAAIFTSTQLEDYGNVILNGYQSTVPNTVNKKAWQYGRTLTPPVNLPSLVQVRPALKGWTTNYGEYYTELPVNAYGVNPGDPTGFYYTVHSFTQATGSIVTIGGLQSGYNYTPGTYTNVATFGGSGTGATLDITVNTDGLVTAATLNNPGTGYTAGDGLGTLAIGPGLKFAVSVITTTISSLAGEPKWAQSPRGISGNGVIPTTGGLYPVPDRKDAPPIGSL